MIIWFDEFGNRREQIYENGTLTAGSYAFDTLYVYWDNETNFKSKTSAQLQGTTVDFKLSNGTTIQGAVTTVESYQIPSLKDFDFKFFTANKVYKVIKCNIPSSVISVSGIVTADIKVMVGGSLVKTLSGVDFVVQGNAATNANISDADYRNILANYMPYVGGTFTGPVVFEQGFSFDELNLNKLQINDLSAIKKTTIGGDEYLDLGDDNNVYISGELYQEGPADFASNVEIEGTLTLGGNITDGTNTISVANIENKQNKVTSISSASTNVQYPSAKLLFDTKEALSTRIGNLENRGRFLGVWNCTTGQPTTFPTIPEGATYPYTYTYRAGDYYIIGAVGQTNKKPSGTGITKPDATHDWMVPSVNETGTPSVNATYTYDGTAWVLGGAGANAAWGSIAGTLNDQTDLKNALDLKANDNAVVHLTGAENVSGLKTFADGISIDGTANLANNFSVGPHSTDTLILKYNDSNVEWVSSSAHYFTEDIRPSPGSSISIGSSAIPFSHVYSSQIDLGNNCAISSTASNTIYLNPNGYRVYSHGDVAPDVNSTGENGYSLGDASYKWKDLYLSGKLKDGTNEVSVADIANKFPIIDAPSSSTLTDAEFEIFKTGCVVKGSFLGKTNPMFMPAFQQTGWRWWGGIVVYSFVYSNEIKTAISSYKIDTNKNISISVRQIAIDVIGGIYDNLELEFQRINIDGVTDLYLGSKNTSYQRDIYINARKYPSYPSSPASNKVLTYKTDNTLGWEDIGPSITTDHSSSSITLSPSKNNAYSYGALSSLTIDFTNADGSLATDEISITFVSGATPTTLTLNGSNKVHDAIVPSTNKVCELNARWDTYLSKWVILYAEVTNA